MKYLTVEELKESKRREAQEVLHGFAGKSARDNFGIALFNSHHDRFFADRRATRILDCGTAGGGFVVQLAQAGYRELFGADVDDYRAEGARALYREFKVVDLSSERLPWPDGFFHAATAWCVLPHLENPFHAVREVHRVLAPGGLFIFTAPHLTSKPSVDYFLQHKDFRSYRPSNNHIVLFPLGVIRKTILRYFDLVDTAYPVRQKVFRGPMGNIRAAWHRLSCVNPRWRRAVESRWAYHAAYVLRKGNV